MSRPIRCLLVIALALAGVAIAVPASAGPDGCGQAHWGSLAQGDAELGPGHLVAARSGRHECWDRVVFELDGPATGYSVAYADRVVEDGSGAPLPVPGGARLQVTLHHPAYDQQANPTFPGRVGRQVADVRGYSTLRAVVYGGSFEGYSTFGVGTRARLPFRVFTLDGPGPHGRIVLDVAHHW